VASGGFQGHRDLSSETQIVVSLTQASPCHFFFFFDTAAAVSKPWSGQVQGAAFMQTVPEFTFWAFFVSREHEITTQKGLMILTQSENLRGDNK
jgi:hypothetical protein